MVSFITGFLDTKELNDRSKEEKQRQEAKKILYSHAKTWTCVEL